MPSLCGTQEGAGVSVEENKAVIREVGVREGGACPPIDVLEALGAVLMLGDGRVVDVVLRHELVDEVQIVVVVDLLYQATDDGLVLFCRHGDLPSSSYETKAS